MKNINTITKEKVVLKYVLDDISELKDVVYDKVIPDKDYLKKSLEITYKNKDKILIIDYIKNLTSKKVDKEGDEDGRRK